MAGLFRRAMDYLYLVCVVIGCTALVLISAVIPWAVFTRYVLNSAASWPEPVAVLSDEMNEKLFGGHNSVGKTVRISDRDFKVVGVLASWKPNVRFYDLTQNALQPVEKIYIPLNLLRPMKIHA